MSHNQVDEMDGVEMTETENRTSPLLTEDEQRILDFYDRLEELQQEIAFLKAQGVLSQGELALFVIQKTVIEIHKLQMNPWKLPTKISHPLGKKY
jgi:hypothetical protein